MSKSSVRRIKARKKIPQQNNQVAYFHKLSEELKKFSQPTRGETYTNYVPTNSDIKGSL